MINPFEKAPRNEFEANSAIGKNVEKTGAEKNDKQERDDIASKISAELEQALNENTTYERKNVEKTDPNTDTA